MPTPSTQDVIGVLGEEHSWFRTKSATVGVRRWHCYKCGRTIFKDGENFLTDHDYDRSKVDPDCRLERIAQVMNA